MSAGGGTSKQFAIFEKLEQLLLSNSSQWRMTNDVDLIVRS